MSSRCPLTNDNEGSLNLCTNKVEYAFFDYNPHLWPAALFVSLFGLSTILHLVQGIRSKRYWLLGTMVLCGVSETLGWSARLWANRSVQWIAINGGYWYSNRTAFLMQISTLIFAPAFLAAGWYICLGRIIKALGPQYCRFNPLTYTITFVLGDLASLIVQAVGGGLASAAKSLAEANRGARIMVGGVIVQMVIMILYTALLLEFVYRYWRKKSVAPLRIYRTKAALAMVPEGSIPTAVERKVKILLGAMLCSTLLIFIRSIYRTIELLDGWHGPIIANETLFCVLDALMVIIAMAIFNVIHPGAYLPSGNPSSEFMEEKSSTPTLQTPSASDV